VFHESRRERAIHRTTPQDRIGNPTRRDLGEAGLARRDFLRYLAASPLLLSAGSARAVESLLAEAASSDAGLRELIAAATEAVNVFDFEPVARRNLSPAHYTFLSMGIQDEFTLRANREAFGRVRLRPRRLMVLDWDFVDRIREETSMKLVLEGILTHEDARLAAFGQEGVETVLEILRGELETIMTEMGTVDVAAITQAHVAIR